MKVAVAVTREQEGSRAARRNGRIGVRKAR